MRIDRKGIGQHLFSLSLLLLVVCWRMVYSGLRTQVTCYGP